MLPTGPDPRTRGNQKDHTLAGAHAPAWDRRDTCGQLTTRETAHWNTSHVGLVSTKQETQFHQPASSIAVHHGDWWSEAFVTRSRKLGHIVRRFSCSPVTPNQGERECSLVYLKATALRLVSERLLDNSWNGKVHDLSKNALRTLLLWDEPHHLNGRRNWHILKWHAREIELPSGNKALQGTRRRVQ